MKSTKQIYDFLNSYKLGVIATVSSNNGPNAAIIGFGQTSSLELLFGTNVTSRKYTNLSRDSHVAFTVGGQTAETLQYEGIARELGASELDLIRNNYWQKNPHAQKHHANPSERYFIVAPTWIRYTDLRTDPWDVTELSF
jgi:general stress protein 26